MELFSLKLFSFWFLPISRGIKFFRFFFSLVFILFGKKARREIDAPKIVLCYYVYGRMGENLVAIAFLELGN